MAALIRSKFSELIDFCSFFEDEDEGRRRGRRVVAVSGIESLTRSSAWDRLPRWSRTLRDHHDEFASLGREFLGQEDAPVPDVQLRSDGVLGRLERHGMVRHHFEIALGNVLNLVAQHSKIDIDSGWLVSSVFDLDGHNIALRPRQHPRSHAPAARGHQPVIDG
jgi:hypothetical protein